MQSNWWKFRFRTNALCTGSLINNFLGERAIEKMTQLGNFEQSGGNNRLIIIVRQIFSQLSISFSLISIDIWRHRCFSISFLTHTVRYFCNWILFELFFPIRTFLIGHWIGQKFGWQKKVQNQFNGFEMFHFLHVLTDYIVHVATLVSK